MIRPWWGEYVGLPFVDGGRGANGVDCWGLVRLVYADHLSIALPTYGEISAHDLARIARQMRAGQDDGWRCPAVPQDFDICLMRGPRGGVATVHVGLVAGPGHILHCEEVTGTVRVPVTHFTIAGRITGYRRRSP